LEGAALFYEERERIYSEDSEEGRIGGGDLGKSPRGWESGALISKASKEPSSTEGKKVAISKSGKPLFHSPFPGERTKWIWEGALCREGGTLPCDR